MSEVCRFIAAEKANHPVALLCRVPGVARSTFCAWLDGEEARKARERADQALAHEITVIHLALRGTYGVVARARTAHATIGLGDLKLARRLAR